MPNTKNTLKYLKYLFTYLAMTILSIIIIIAIAMRMIQMMIAMIRNDYHIHIANDVESKGDGNEQDYRKHHTDLTMRNLNYPRNYTITKAKESLITKN